MPGLNQKAMAQIRKNQASRIVDMPLNTWKDIGDEIANHVRELVGVQKVLGDTYTYSSQYAARKSARKAAPRQASTEMTRPDLTLTGKMLNNFRQMEIKKFSVGLGMARVHVNKMQFNADRNPSLDMLHKTKVLNPIQNDISKRIGRQFDKNIRKWSKGDIVISIGK